MRTQKDLFKEGTNPFYEVFNSHDATVLKMVLDENEIEYNDVPHNGTSKRFYVETKDENFIVKKSEEYAERIKSGAYNKPQFDYEYGLCFQYFKR